MVFGVRLGGFSTVVGCMLVVAVSCMGMMRRLLMVASLVVYCSLFVMACGVLVMFRSLVMVLSSFF